MMSEHDALLSSDLETSPRFLAQELLSFLQASATRDVQKLTATTQPTSPTTTASAPLLLALRKQHLQISLETDTLTQRAQHILQEVDQKFPSGVTAEQEMTGLRAAVAHLRARVQALPQCVQNTPPAAATLPTSQANQQLADRCEQLATTVQECTAATSTTLFPFMRKDLFELVGAVRKEIETVPTDVLTLNRVRTVSWGREGTDVQSCMDAIGLNATFRSVEGLCEEQDAYQRQMQQERLDTEMTAAWCAHAAKGGAAAAATRRETKKVVGEIARRREELVAALKLVQSDPVESSLSMFRVALETEKKAARASRLYQNLL